MKYCERQKSQKNSDLKLNQTSRTMTTISAFTPADDIALLIGSHLSL